MLAARAGQLGRAGGEALRSRRVRQVVGLLLGSLLVFVPFRMALFDGWDDAFYVAQLTSMLGDRDLVLHDDLLAYDLDTAGELRSIALTTPDGALLNTFSVGPAVLHSAHAWPLFLSGDPPSSSLRAALSIASMVFLVLFFLATKAAVRKCGFSPAMAALSTLLAIVGGPLALYGPRLHLNSHLPSALMAALCLLAALTWAESGQVRHAAGFGLASGMLVLQRWQDALIVAALAIPMILMLRQPSGTSRRARLRGLAVGFALMALCVAVQLVAWQVQFGRPLLVPQGREYMHWLAPRLLAFLISGYHGLIPWMPVFAAGLVALPWVARSSQRPFVRQVATSLAIAAVGAVYVSACVHDWWGGASFGPRRLASLTPAAALGLAAVASRVSTRARVILAACTCAWAVWVTSAFLSGWDDLAVLTLGRPSVHSPVGADAYTGLRWIDDWGPLHSVKPGFSLSDRPRNADRVRGAAIAFAAVAFACAMAALVARSAAAQRSVVILGAGWMLLWLGVLQLRVPRNDAWNEEWKALLAGGGTISASWPRGLKDAGHVALAVRAAAAGDDGRMQDALARIEQQEHRLDAEAIRDFAARPAASPVLTLFGVPGGLE